MSGATLRFWAKVDKSDDCWIWRGATLRNGYGYFAVVATRVGQRNQLAHRFAYESEVGPIPEGLVLDHLCRNKACVNPAHLEAVTQRENVLRGDGPRATREVRAAMTMCRRGHDYLPDNLYVDKRGRRTCKACARVSDRDRKRTKREQARAAA